MKFQITIGLILLSILGSKGQGTLLLQDGQKINFTKKKESGDKLILTDKKQKREINVNEVKGYFEDYEFIIYYKKPFNSTRNQYLRRTLEGKINLYQKTTTTKSYNGNGGYSYINSEEYYIEKGDRFELIFETGVVGQGKKQRIEILKSLVSDSDVTLNSISEDFKLTSENLINVIRNYNIQKYESKVTLDTSSLSTIVFYRVGKDIAKSISERIQYRNLSDDSISISIHNKSFILPSYEWQEVKIPVNELIKMCMGNTNSYCDLINAHNLFKIYIEVGHNKKSGEFYIKQTGYQEGISVLSRLEENRKWKRKKI